MKNIAGQGIVRTDLVNVFNEYFKDNNNYLMMGCTSDEVHYIGIGCYLNLGDIENAHYAMYVGHGQSNYWQIFKKYWDIVVSWDSNIIANSSDYFVGGDKNNSNCYYAIDR